MARTKKKRWSYTTGKKGRNRVRAYERENGTLMLEWRHQGQRRRTRLDHTDRDRAERQADAAKAELATVGTLDAEERHDMTLGELFETYLGEVTPTKGQRSQKHDHAASTMFSSYWGPTRVVSTLNLRDWERFIRDRGAGQVGHGEGPYKAVGDRTVERDLRLMLAVLNWATMAGDGHGGVLLERNPFRGYKTPKEKNPLRVFLTDAEYEVLLGVSMDIDWRFHVALVLAHETGHRIGAVRKLRWSDIDLEERSIFWRAENEKTGYEHITPVTERATEALEALLETRSHTPGTGGDTPVLPAPKDSSQPISRHLVKNWWKKAERLAGLEPKPGRGWHSFRRKFASDLKDLPLKTLCQLGGWKTHQTVLICYQHADDQEMREALTKRRTGSSTDTANGHAGHLGTTEEPRARP